MMTAMLDLSSLRKESRGGVLKQPRRARLPRRRLPSSPTIQATPSLADTLYALLVSY
jgi:hypothetical protein